MDFIELVKQSAEKKIIYSRHALDEMNAEAEIITTEKWEPDFKTRRKK